MYLTKNNKMNLRITPYPIVDLKENEVYVFGTNDSGFHGAGSAGHAFRFDNHCNWRFDDSFIKAMNSFIGSPERVGKWAVYGQSTGLMEGQKGKSYGIPTIKQAGKKCSKSLDDINASVYIFTGFAIKNPHLTFYVVELGTQLAGWSVEDIAPMFESASQLENVYLPKSFHDIICRLI